MGLIGNLLLKLGLKSVHMERTPITVFLLDDDRRRHRWFEKRFSGDDLDIAETVEEAKEFLAEQPTTRSFSITICFRIITSLTITTIMPIPAMRSPNG